jgi:predicted PurR-regulated permease PerM
MIERRRAPTLPRALTPFVTVATIVLIVSILSRAQVVLVPIAFALVLSFVLTPPVRWLQRLRLPRSLAIALVMLIALGAIGGGGYTLAGQLADLSTQITRYTESMRRKLSALRRRGDGAIGNLEKTVDKVSEVLEDRADDVKRAEPVRVVPEGLSPIERIEATVEPILEPLISALIVLVLCAFILGRREDLRNRLIRLVGPNNVTLTTRTIDEATHRISRYLLDQTMINVGFGAVVAGGLFMIGVPYAALWGGLAAVLRFVPYVGATASMLMPAALAFAVFPGWRETLLTVGLFLGLDILTAYFIEPMFIGHRTGVASIALLVSTIFWTWLWGGVGLVLATPITVSLAVLGRHVPQLQFLDVLLGDQQVLDTEITYYQRLLARDDDEASVIAERKRVELGPVAAMEQVVLPALLLAARDHRRGEIADEDIEYITTASGEVIDALALAADDAADAPAPTPAAARRIAGVPGGGPSDALLLRMLSSVVAPTLGPIEIAPGGRRAEETATEVAAGGADLVCIAGFASAGAVHARRLCRRLREAAPRLPIIVLRPGDSPDDASEGLREAGADAVTSTLAETAAVMAQHLAPAPARKGDGPIF